MKVVILFFAIIIATTNTLSGNIGDILEKIPLETLAKLPPGLIRDILSPDDCMKKLMSDFNNMINGTNPWNFAGIILNSG